MPPEDRPAPIGAPPGFRHEPLDEDDLNLLEDTSVLALEPQTGWTRVDLTVDSGSATSCLPERLLPPA